MSSAGFLSILCLISGMTLSVSATAADLSPAGFGSDEKALHKLIVFPDVSVDIDKSFVCQGILKKNGRMKQSGCYIVEPRDAPYVEAINKAAKKAQFVPATYAGKKIGIYFLYIVRFARKDDEQRILLYPNQGYSENIEAYGINHVAAQRSVTRELWESVCPNRARFSVLARVHIAEDGLQSSINISHGSGIAISGQCEQAIVQTIENSVFIPAFADGESVPSAYLEPFGN